MDYLSKIDRSKALGKLQEAGYATGIQTLFNVYPVCIGSTDRHWALQKAVACGHVLREVEADFEVNRETWATQAHDPAVKGQMHDVRDVRWQICMQGPCHIVPMRRCDMVQPVSL